MKYSVLFLGVIVSGVINGCGGKPPSEPASTPTAGASPTLSATSALTTSVSTPDVELLPLREGIWLHRSYADVPPWGRVAANGIVLVGKTEALLIDTPWNDAETEWLFLEVKKRFKVPITKVIATHAHDDNLGGLAAAHRLGARSFAEALTVKAAEATFKTIPTDAFSSDLVLEAADTTVELFYPGPGHTKDNIVVYLPTANLLFGGCFIKAEDAQSLGNTAEADVEHWASSIEAVEKKFPDAESVVPGHGEAGDRSLLAHTSRLVSSALLNP